MDTFELILDALALATSSGVVLFVIWNIAQESDKFSQFLVLLIALVLLVLALMRVGMIIKYGFDREDK